MILLGILLSAILLGLPLVRILNSAKQDKFDELILDAAGENGCDPSLVKAVIWRESKFDPDTHGKDGELGLMQVMPTVGQEWASARGIKNFTAQDLLKPEINLRAGSWYLARAIQQWTQASKPIPMALAQYNAGRSNVLKWVDPDSYGDPDHFLTRVQFPTTRAYVRDILKQYQRYKLRGEF